MRWSAWAAMRPTRSCRNSPNCAHSSLVALVSGTPAKLEKFGAQYGIPKTHRYSYQNYDRIRDNPDIDVVYVVLPNAMHAEHTIRAARAGKHVCAKSRWRSPPPKPRR